MFFFSVEAPPLGNVVPGEVFLHPYKKCYNASTGYLFVGCPGTTVVVSIKSTTSGQRFNGGVFNERGPPFVRRSYLPPPLHSHFPGPCISHRAAVALVAIFITMDAAAIAKAVQTEIERQQTDVVYNDLSVDELEGVVQHLSARRN